MRKLREEAGEGIFGCAPPQPTQGGISRENTAVDRTQDQEGKSGWGWAVDSISSPLMVCLPGVRGDNVAALDNQGSPSKELRQDNEKDEGDGGTGCSDEEPVAGVQLA